MDVNEHILRRIKKNIERVKNMKIGFGCDPYVAELINALISSVEELAHEIIDYGSEDPIYFNVAKDVAEAVVRKEVDRGIVICGTGIGISISANKVKGAYCALVTNVYQAQRAQLSNNANMMALGSQVTGIQ